jgi:hypothetical protein
MVESAVHSVDTLLTCNKAAYDGFLPQEIMRVHGTGGALLVSAQVSALEMTRHGLDNLRS